MVAFYCQQVMRFLFDAGFSNAFLAVDSICCDQGSSEVKQEKAIPLLFIKYESGDGIGQSPLMALSFYKKAHGEGNTTAGDRLAVMFSDGIGIPEDVSFSTLAHLTHEASDSIRDSVQNAMFGDPQAQYDTGMALSEGKGFYTSKKLALQWLDKAVQTGHPGVKQAAENFR